MKTLHILAGIMLATTLASCSTKTDQVQNPDISNIRVLTSQKPVLIDGKLTTEEIVENVLLDVNRLFHADMWSLLREFSYVTVIKLNYPPQEPESYIYEVVLSNLKPTVTEIEFNKDFEFNGPQLWFRVDMEKILLGHKLTYYNKFNFIKSQFISWSLTLETKDILVQN